jgi:hypothetical protein
MVAIHLSANFFKLRIRDCVLARGKSAEEKRYLRSLWQWQRSIKHSFQSFSHNVSTFFPFIKLRYLPCNHEPSSLEADMNILLWNIMHIKTGDY